MSDASSRSSGGNMFESASQVIIHGGSFVGAQNNIGSSDVFTQNIRRLHDEVSPNAILNAGGRVDTVRCFPGTREAVMSQIDNWIDAEDNASSRIFWLSGPAGAGKSAIAQSIAERCTERKIPMANFFFFRADETRNHALPLVATLLYQIIKLFPPVLQLIDTLIAGNPLIFQTSVEEQFRSLISPLLAYPFPNCSKIVLVIDGLDECSSENTSVQQDILRMLNALVSEEHSPFVILVGSRTEAHLVMAFNSIQSQVTRLFLDGNSFRASDDIKHFVVCQFRDIQRTHHLARTLDTDWPSACDVSSIVFKSSGHFIYAATVMRFIQMSPESPALSLERVQGVRPIENHSPFSQLDAIYAHILAQSKHWPKAKDILAAQVLPYLTHESRASSAGYHKIARGVRSPALEASYRLYALDYDAREVSSYTSDLTALIKVDDNNEVKFYHTSLSDFLLDKRRASQYFIDLEEFRAKLVPALFHRLSSSMNKSTWSLVVGHFIQLRSSSPALTEALSDSPAAMQCIGFNVDTVHEFLMQLEALYLNTNTDLYEMLLWRWLIRFKTDEVEFQEKHLRSIQYAAGLWNKLTPGVVNPQIEVHLIHENNLASEQELSSDFTSWDITPPQLLSPPPTPRGEERGQSLNSMKHSGLPSSSASIVAAQQSASMTPQRQQTPFQFLQEGQRSPQKSEKIDYLSPPSTPLPTQSQEVAEVPPDSYLLEVFEDCVAEAALREANAVFEEARTACAEVAAVRGEILIARIDLATAKAEAKFVRDDAATTARLEVQAARVEAELIRAEAMRYSKLQMKAARAEARDIRAKAAASANIGVEVSRVDARLMHHGGSMSDCLEVSNVQAARPPWTSIVRTPENMSSTVHFLRRPRTETESGCSWIFI